MVRAFTLNQTEGCLQDRKTKHYVISSPQQIFELLLYVIIGISVRCSNIQHEIRLHVEIFRQK